MSDLEPKSEDRVLPERTTTSFMLDQHFSECSMPAGNANALAHELIQEKLSIPQQAFVIDKSGFREEFVARRFLTTAIVDHHESDALRFALATSLGENKSPRLIAFFNGDLAVQVAAFEIRDDDRCNFVQLGQEFRDESYIAHTNDHSRLEYIHAIKALLADNPNPKDLDLLTEFTLSEIDLIQQEPLGSERLAGIQRKLQEQIERARTTKPVRIHLANGEDVPAQGMLETTFPDWDLAIPLSDGREISLVALQHCAPRSKLGSLMLRGKLRTTGQGNIILAAKTDEDIAVPLYEFSEHGTAVLDTFGKPITRDEAATLQRLVENANDTRNRCIQVELEDAERKKIVSLGVLIAKSNLGTLIDMHTDENLYDAILRSDPGEDEDAYHTYFEMNIRDPIEHSTNLRPHVDTVIAMLENGPDSAREVTDPASKDVYTLCKEFWEKPYGRVDLTSRLANIFVANGIPGSTADSFKPLICFAELTKELQDAATNPRWARVAFVQQTSIQEKISESIGKYQPKLDALKDRLAELSEISVGIARGKYVEYPTSTGKTNLDVSAEVSYKNGTYKLRLFLVPDGQQGKKDPLVRFDGEVSRVRANHIDNDEIDELLDLLKVIDTRQQP